MSLCCGRFRRPTGWRGYVSGYAVGDPDIMTALGKVYVPFSATSISQAAAIASLDAADELLARTDAVVAERARVTGAAGGRLHRSAVAGQLRLAAAGRTHPGLRQQRRRQPPAGPAVRRGRRAGHRRRPAGDDAFIEFAQRWIGEK